MSAKDLGAVQATSSSQRAVIRLLRYNGRQEHTMGKQWEVGINGERLLHYVTTDTGNMHMNEKERFIAKDSDVVRCKVPYSVPKINVKDRHESFNVIQSHCNSLLPTTSSTCLATACRRSRLSFPFPSASCSGRRNLRLVLLCTFTRFA